MAQKSNFVLLTPIVFKAPFSLHKNLQESASALAQWNLNPNQHHLRLPGAAASASATVPLLRQPETVSDRDRRTVSHPPLAVRGPGSPPALTPKNYANIEPEPGSSHWQRTGRVPAAGSAGPGPPEAAGTRAQARADSA